MFIGCSWKSCIAIFQLADYSYEIRDRHRSLSQSEVDRHLGNLRT